jgi:integrase
LLARAFWGCSLANLLDSWKAQMGYTQKLATGKWRARWRAPDGTLRSKTFARERDAVRHLRHQEVAVDLGEYIDGRAGKIPFAEWTEHYQTLARRRVARKTYARDLTLLRNYVLPRWGGIPLNRIRKEDVERWVADLAAEGAAVRGGTLAPLTVQEIYRVLHKILVAAVEADRIARVPCPAHAPIARSKRKPVRFLTEVEVHRLAEAIAPRYEAMIYVGAYGGFRIGELCALRVDDIDWRQCSIRVDEGVTEVSGHLAFEDPKTPRSFRTVAIADLAMEKLEGHLTRYGNLNDQRALLFEGPKGGVVRPNHWRKRAFRPAAAAAGLLPLTPHDLRHTTASLLISAGANPWMLAEILGHADTRMIDRIYGHLFQRDREDLRQRMSERARQT